MYDLTGFQRDLLYVVAGLDDPHGLAIKDELEDYYEKEIHHGRLYPTSTRSLRRDSSKKVSGTDGPTSTALLAGAREKSKLGLNGKPSILTTTGDRTAVFEDCLTLVFRVPQKPNYTSNSTKHPTEEQQLFVNKKNI